jgi:hypothetical protein
MIDEFIFCEMQLENFAIFLLPELMQPNRCVRQIMLLESCKSCHRAAINDAGNKMEGYGSVKNGHNVCVKCASAF